MPVQDRPYHGLYINLERSPDRRARMENALTRFGLSDFYSRLNATDGRTLTGLKSTISPGQLGCFHSHMRALEGAKTGGHPVHVMEDDAILSEPAAPVISNAVQTGFFDRYDILFTDTFVDFNPGMLKTLRAMFEAAGTHAPNPANISELAIIDLERQNFSCLTSYVVGPRSFDRILSLYRQEWARGASAPVDLFIRDAVHAGKLRAAVVFPFLTSLSLDDIYGSTIDERAGELENPSVMVYAVLRYLFFIGRDVDYAKRHLDAVTKSGRTPQSMHHALILQALEFAMSTDFKGF